MPLPTEGPTTPARVKAWAGVTADDKDAMIGNVVDAVNEVVRALPIVADADRDTYPAEWPERVATGATMLAARVFRRRNSIDGVQPMADSVAYVSRTDPDVAQLLQIGAYEKPAVG